MNDNVIATGNPDASAASTALQVIAQYVKDLSFENPNAPGNLQQKTEPKVEVNVDVKAVKVSETTYEVTLITAVTGYNDDTRLFIAELTYAGVFAFTGIEDAQLQPYLLVECPRLLFPFCRAIIADVTRDGGFPPLLIQPIDFARLYLSSQQDSELDTAE